MSCPSGSRAEGLASPAGRELPPGGQRAVLEAAARLRTAGRAGALALVAGTEGSTYRKAGALALVDDDGSLTGVISGGCLESGLAELGRSAIAAGEPHLTVFDTRGEDDLVFGSGSGCRGRMRVLALPLLPDRAAPALESLLEAQAARRPQVLNLATLAPALGMTGTVVVRPSPRLLLVGAGPEAPPLLALARTLGWFAWIADHREGLLVPERIANADRVLHGRVATTLANLDGEPCDAALVMTHLAEEDLAALARLAVADVPYVGLLGPPARRDELLSRLSPVERAALAGRLQGPAGLRLGGDGPEAIALAIAAQLQRAFNDAHATAPPRR